MNSLFRSALRLLDQVSPPEPVHAHCDIPCGIYDPHLAQIGAHTVIRMHQLIADLTPPDAGDSAAVAAYQNSMNRYVAVKEEHAELVKREVRIIRGDFFKPDNSPANIDELVDGIMKTASAARQNVDKAAAEKLLAQVNQFAEAFWKAKDVQTKKVSSNQAAGGEYVVPAA